jgi:hypothetical protein
MTCSAVSCSSVIPLPAQAVGLAVTTVCRWATSQAMSFVDTTAGVWLPSTRTSSTK